MRSNSFLPLVLAVLFLTSSGLAHSQVEASASRSSPPFSIGAGASDFNVDWKHNRMYAATLWIDWHPATAPSFLRGIGAEVEGHHLNYGRPSTLPSNFRQDTILGGPIYTLPGFRNFSPYGKCLIGFGSFDFQGKGHFPNGVPYTHDTRHLYEMGGGFDYRVWRHVVVRADYGYQVWEPLFSNTRRPDPQGVTVGLLYDFRILPRR